MMNTSKTVYGKRKHVKAIVIIAMLAVLLEGLLVLMTPPITHYEQQGNVYSIDLKRSYRHIDSVLENGKHIVTGGDPQFVLDTDSFGEICSVLLTLEQPINGMLPCQLFYHSGFDERPFSEGTSLVKLLLPGETQLLFELDSRIYKNLRFDIQKNCLIESITVSDKGFSKVYLPKEKISFLPLRAAALFVAMCAVYVCLRRNGNKLRSALGKACEMPVKRISKVIVLLVCAAIAAYFLYHLLWVFGFPATQDVKVFCITTCLCVAACFLLKQHLTHNPEYLFAVIALAAGLLFIVYMPADPVNSWDEVYHMNNAFEAAYVVKYIELFNLKDIWAVLSAVFIHFGLLLRVSFETILRLGKLGNLLLYILIGMLAIRHTKNGKMILSVLLLAPTNMLMASSFSYDPFITVMIMLAFSIFFDEWSRKDETINMKNVLLMLLIMTMGVQPKAIYAVMMLVFVCMPQNKFKSNKQRNQYYLMVLGAGLLIILSFIGSFLFDVRQGGGSDLRGGSDVNAGRQLVYIFSHPLEYTKTLLTFLLSYLEPAGAQGYISSLAYLGSAPNFTLVLLLLAVVVFTDWHGMSGFEGEGWYVRAYSMFILFGLVCLIATGLYVSFTPVALNRINGCQPRYLMPLLFPSVYLLGCVGIRNEMNRAVYNGVVLSISTYSILAAVLCCAIL